MDDIELEFSLKPDADNSIGQYVLAFEGTARLWDERSSQERRIGVISGHRVDLAAALYDGLGQDEILDCLTPEIAEFAETVLGGKRCLLPASTSGSLSPTDCDGLVYVAELWIDPEFRGRGLGSELLRRLGSTLDLERCLIALKARPIREDPAKVSTPEEIARVQDFYRRQGFEDARDDYMVKDARLCEAVKKRVAARLPAAARDDGSPCP